MGTHGATAARPRALPAGDGKATRPVNGNPGQGRGLTLSDWPVARRLFTVIVAALVMGLVFGGLRVADAVNSASQFSRTQQLAKLNVQLLTLADALENERDTTLLLFAKPATTQQATLTPVFAKTDAAAKAVTQAAGINGLPGNIQAIVNQVLGDISPANLKDLHGTINSTQGDTSVVDSFGAIITDVINLVGQVGQGVSDATLSGDVQTLNSLALAKEQLSRQRGLLNSALSNPAGHTVNYHDGTNVVTSPPVDTADATTVEALAVAYHQELADLNAFYPAATPAERQYYVDQTSRPDDAGTARNIETNVLFVNSNTDYLIGSGNKAVDTGVSVPGSQLIPSLQGVPELEQMLQASKTKVSDKELEQRGLAAWDTGIGGQLAATEATEMLIAGNIENRASQLLSAAQQSALVTGIITIAVLFVVLLAALLVARSLVLPLRRLRVGALDVASVQLPERVRLLTDSPEDVTSMEVAPINVASRDEIGEVARAFDRVHSEAVRLAGEQALLRASFNSMFTNLSRRSQTLIERLARMIDNLEQSEDDPDRLGSLFSMDHLVTRMRRNSENLLLLAGHENPRKWSEAVPVADIARAATSEIEQYNRVTLNIPPGVSISGQAVSDVVHLLAELIENATMFSPKDTQVHVSMQELSSGGLLIEVVDKGIGVSDARLADMNWRLDNPPTVDVSVSRHMGLFAVARLAERHRVRVRLRPAPPQGLSALVWLPDGVIERTKVGAGTNNWSAQPVGARARTGSGTAETAALTSGGGGVGLATSYAGGSGSGSGNTGSEGRTASGWFRGGQDVPAQPTGGQRDDFFGEPSVSGSQTVSGLPVRVPRTSLPPGSGTAGPADGPGGGLPTRTIGASGRSVGSGQGNVTGGGNPLPKRSPEQARNRLAGFQRGTQRAAGQGGSGQAPRAGEGTNR